MLYRNKVNSLGFQELTELGKEYEIDQTEI